MSKSMNIIVLAVLLVTKTSCSSSNAKDCKIKVIKTLFTTVGIHDRDTSYGHYTLINDFPRECMDSASMVNLALKYSDTVKFGKPADIIMFFNSDKDFIPNETSQIMEEINKSCLVVIGIDAKTKMPNDFIFYNEKGERLYWGKRWLPNGK